MKQALFDITFAYPWVLLLLLLLPLLFIMLYSNRRRSITPISISDGQGLQQFSNWKTKLRPWLFVPLLLSLGFLIIALARPRNTLDEVKIKSEGIDIVLTIDVSQSMLARDFEPDRLEACKRISNEFINARVSDRIGIVIFSGESFSLCPITTDHHVLNTQMNTIQSGLMEDGTAIGMGLATAVNRLRESTAKSKVIILLTDGVNNKGMIDPLTATETAKTLGIKVYTIGVGTQGIAPFPQKTLFGTILQQMQVEIDEELLTKIANETNGKYFRATNNNSLKEIYAAIDRLEKTEVETTSIQKHTEQYRLWVILSLICLMTYIVGRWALLKSIND
jgi:Ca-activated chloride channel family protein